MFGEAYSIMLKASMVLSKCSSNSQVVSSLMLREYGVKYSELEAVKILGFKWVSQLDYFSFEGMEVPPDVITTKRVVLSMLARLYDPLGFLTPFTMFAKLLMQEIWLLGVDWDEGVPEQLHNQFVAWLNGLTHIKEWGIPRCYTGGPWKALRGIELHAFGDASEKGYGAAVYIRIPQGDGSFEVSLVVARGKVAPLKRVTLPRLELLGALLCARLVIFVSSALRLPDVRYKCWTDSTVALAWVQGDSSKWKPFVANRVA